MSFLLKKKSSMTRSLKPLLSSAEKAQHNLYKKLKKMKTDAVHNVSTKTGHDIVKMATRRVLKKQKRARKTRRKIANNIKLGKSLADSMERYMKKKKSHSKSKTGSRRRQSRTSRRSRSTTGRRSSRMSR